MRAGDAAPVPDAGTVGLAVLQTLRPKGAREMWWWPPRRRSQVPLPGALGRRECLIYLARMSWPVSGGCCLRLQGCRAEHRECVEQCKGMENNVIHRAVRLHGARGYESAGAR